MGLTLKTLDGQIYIFEGPYTSADYLHNQSGVYVISTKALNEMHNIIDIGESQDVKTRVSSHDCGDLWGKHVVDMLYVSVLYCDERARMLVEQQLRAAYNPPVGYR